MTTKTKTTKAFTKGEAATLIANWNSKGTFYARDVIVHSCGAKRMVLTDPATGEEVGREFAPVRAVAGELKQTAWHGSVFARMTEDEARAECLRLAAEFIARRKSGLDRLLTVNADAGEGYANAIKRDIAALHEPRFMTYAEACAEVAARVAAKRAG